MTSGPRTRTRLTQTATAIELTTLAGCPVIWKSHSLGFCRLAHFMCFLDIFSFTFTLIQSIACRTCAPCSGSFASLIARPSFACTSWCSVSLNACRLSAVHAIGGGSSVAGRGTVSSCRPRLRRRFRFDNFRCLLWPSLHLDRCLACAPLPDASIWFCSAVAGSLMFALLLSPLPSANSING